MVLTEILKKAKDEKTLDVDDIKTILKTSKPEDVQRIFQLARDLRSRHFNDTVFTYGFVYFSTYCKNKCYFCYYRQDNEKAPRYRKEKSQIVELACNLADSGVNLIDLTMGEDPYFLHKPDELVEIVREVFEKTKLPIMVSPGVVQEDTLRAMKNCGAVWYALYQETYDKTLYSHMRYEQSYEQRISLKKTARELGYLIEEGLMTGFGDTLNQRAQSIFSMGNLKPSQVRTMTFVPQKGTPMENVIVTDNHDELLMIAAMRLSYPDSLIPASLDIEGLIGLKDRLNAGANVITSLIPPQEGLAGVSQSKLNIDDGCRTLEQVLPIVQACNLSLGTHKQYEDFIMKEQLRASK